MDLGMNDERFPSRDGKCLTGLIRRGDKKVARM